MFFVFLLSGKGNATPFGGVGRFPKGRGKDWAWFSGLLMSWYRWAGRVSSVDPCSGCGLPIWACLWWDAIRRGCLSTTRSLIDKHEGVLILPFRLRTSIISHSTREASEKCITVIDRTGTIRSITMRLLIGMPIRKSADRAVLEANICKDNYE